MNTKRLIILITAMALATSCLWAREDNEVIVTRQLTTGQRNALPEKTIAVEMKRLTAAKKANTGLIDAINMVMDTIASEDYQNRTFVLLLEHKADGQIGIGVRSDDIVTRGNKDASIYYGDMEYQRYHFVVLANQDNADLLEQTFKRQGKVNFVQEFEFVDFKTMRYPTSVAATWSPSTGLSWQSVVINDDPNDAHSPQDRPTSIQD